MSLWCKFWNFFLDRFMDVVKGIAYALETVGKVLLDVASEVVKAASSVLGSPVFLIAAGIGAYLLLSKKQDSTRDVLVRDVTREPPRSSQTGAHT